MISETPCSKRDRRRRSKPGNRNGRLIYPVGTELRTVQVVLSFEDWRLACVAGGSRGKAAGGIRKLIQAWHRSHSPPDPA